MGNRRFVTAKWLSVALLVGSLGFAGDVGAALIVESDGVVLDTNAGLEWQQQPGPCCLLYTSALDYQATLALDGGGWRLPTLGEFQALNANLLAASPCTAAACGGFTGLGTFDGYWYADANGVGVFYLFIGSYFNYGFDNFEFNTHGAFLARADDGDLTIPEPGTLALVGLGLAAVTFVRRKRTTVRHRHP